MQSVQTKLPNFFDVDILVVQFLQNRQQAIQNLHRFYLKIDNQLSLRALQERMKEELKSGTITFLNQHSSDFIIEELYNYLLYIANAYCKKIAATDQQNKLTEYICPGCVFLGKEYTPIFLRNKVFQCEECQCELNNIQGDPNRHHLLSIFATHNKTGYRCPDCFRFIPHPLDNSSSRISCPYFDCIFVGSLNDLKKMHHPNSKINPEKLILDGCEGRDGSTKTGRQSRVTIKETNGSLKDRIAISPPQYNSILSDLQDIIDTQSNTISYSSQDATLRHKQYVYQAFSNLLKQYPEEMSAYLSHQGNGYSGFQHRLFQEYVRLLEEALPFFIRKNRKLHKIDSLLNHNLSLFDGISVFEGMVKESGNKGKIKNGTKEFYIGGRKATYTKPYYIGKLLNIIHRDTKASLLHFVREYTFSYVVMEKETIEMPVITTHLRTPPHYQMGGMVYVNRVRKKIAERARTIIKNKVNDI